MAWVLKMDDATIESGLVHDFDASLSGIGQELGAGAYSMRLERLKTTCQSQLQWVVGKNSSLSVNITAPLGVLLPLCWVLWFLFVLGFGLEQSLRGATIRDGMKINFSKHTQRQGRGHVSYCQGQRCFVFVFVFISLHCFSMLQGHG